MSAVVFALLLQSTSISGGLEVPQGVTPPATAQVALLPLEYAKVFNAEVQIRLDNYWEDYKPAFARQKELFFQVMPRAYKSGLDATLARMRRDSKIDSANLIRNVARGQFEFRGVPPGEYKLVATASIGGNDYVWTETLQVASTPIFIQMKNRVP
jgi:hypothetical protein